MAIKAVILESDEETAQTLIEHIEADSDIECLVAPSLKDAKSLLKTQNGVQFLVCAYDVSSNQEQLRERAIIEHVFKHYPEITIASIGTLRKTKVTLSDRKVLLINRDDINGFLKADPNRGGIIHRRFKPKLRAKTIEKRGVYAVQ
ncbi:MAG: hypothetical protein AB7O96_13620 [Pseudobdellovibrionaceae bacterium]